MAHGPRNTAAMLAAILAFFALALCWTPVLGLFTIPLALLAILVAGIGLLVAIFRDGAGIVASLGGGALAVMAMFFATIEW